MAKWGEVKIECDTTGCDAQLVLHAERLRRRTVQEAKTDDGWETSLAGKDICPQCVEEGVH